MRNSIRIILMSAVVIMALGILGSCAAISNSNLTIQFDKVFSEDENNLTSITFSNLSAGEELVYTADSEGILEILEIPRGDYEISIKRFGSIEKFNLTLDKRNMTLDYRLFYDAKGSQIEGTHYIISSTKEFLNLAYMADATDTVYYHLNKDIDFTGVDYKPIERFSGILDGRYYGISTGVGYKITNLTISEASVDNVGLVRINEGEIRNIIFDKVNITGKDNVAVIAGLNHGIISNCDVISGTITAHNYAGSISGLDRGAISLCNSTATIVCSEYYGNIAGISFSNMALGAFIIRPNVSGVTPITTDMTSLDKYQTAIDNWYALENRMVFQRAEITTDLTTTVNTVINNVKSAFPTLSLENLVLGIIGGRDFAATEVIVARRIYEGDIDDGLSRLLVTGGGYTKSTSFDSILSNFMAIPQLAQMISGVDMQFPFGYAVYYDEANNERIEFQMTQDAYVSSDGTISYTLGEEVYTVNITDDLNEYATEEDIDAATVNKVLDYVAEAKSMVLDLTTLDLSLPGAIIISTEEQIINGSRLNFTIDGAIAYKYVFDRIQLAMDTEFAGTIAEGTTIGAIYSKPIKLTVEIWDNGNLKSVRMTDLDMTITINLTVATQEKIKEIVAGIDFNNDGKVNDVKNFQLDKVIVKISGSINDRYSYSRTDTDIDIYLTEFEKDKFRVIDMIKDETE